MSYEDDHEGRVEKGKKRLSSMIGEEKERASRSSYRGRSTTSSGGKRKPALRRRERALSFSAWGEKRHERNVIEAGKKKVTPGLSTKNAFPACEKRKLRRKEGDDLRREGWRGGEK